jgi:hypothetical protein
VLLVVAYRGYVFLVPSVEEGTHYFLKTIIPSREATRDYIGRRAQLKKLNRYEQGILSAYNNSD